ncbi:MAG: 4-(cytidine 5'-diphospho)-2-C-methyl-D-erythritol kinase [Deferribacterales bacterium]
MITANSFAKINLFLHVINKRDDAYHNISTLMTKIDLHDTIVIEPSSYFKIYSNFSDIPLDDNNIMFKVYQKVQQNYKIDPVIIKLYKKIPWGAGLGGGSSNAATFLYMLNILYKLNLTYDDKYNILKEVGSDTVFFLRDSKTVYAEGRGEILYDGPDIPKLQLLLVKPPFPVSTKEAYNGVKLRLTKKFNIDNIARFWNYNELLSKMENDFETTVFEKYPELERIKRFMLSLGADKALMSGSGSTIYGIYSNYDNLCKSYRFFKQYNNLYVTKTNTI